MKEKMLKIVIEKATVADADFISIAIRDAERSHTGIGLYDCLVGDINEKIGKYIDNDGLEIDSVSKVLKYLYLNCESSHIHHSCFLIARNGDTGESMAAACAFPYPEYSVKGSAADFNMALKEVLSFSDDDIQEAWKRCAFLDSSFPDVDCDNSWMLDAVYTSPKYRGHGLGVKMVAAVMAEKDKAKDSPDRILPFRVPNLTSMKDRDHMLACSVGNVAARSVYEKLGFVVLGEGYNEECMKSVKSPGFYLMSKKADP